jgi:hypothetical protein
MRKRRAIAWRVARAVVCGLALTIAVAVVALFAELKPTDYEIAEYPDYIVWESWGATAVGYLGADATGKDLVFQFGSALPRPAIVRDEVVAPSWARLDHRSRLTRVSQGVEHPKCGVVYQVAAGWPWRSVAGYARVADGQIAGEPFTHSAMTGRLTPASGGVGVSDADFGVLSSQIPINIVPYRVIVIPFTANVIVIAAACFATSSAVRYARSQYWKRGHRCRQCGYSRTGIEAGQACPECGTPRV